MWFLLLIQHIGVDCTPTAPPYAVGHPYAVGQTYAVRHPYAVGYPYAVGHHADDVCLLWFWLVVSSADLKMHQLWQQDTQGFGVDCTPTALSKLWHIPLMCASGFWFLDWLAGLKIHQLR
jgi:hypothetical protein